MLRLTLLEFIVRLIPEAFLITLAISALPNTRLNVKKYIISSSLLGTCMYGIRMLPINYGVHTILNIIVMSIIACSINKTSIILAIKASLITTIGLFIFEGLNMLLLSLVFKDTLGTIMLNTTLKTIYGLPSLICFAIAIISYYLRKRNI